MLRTIAVWNRAPFVTVPLVAASLGQWGILCYNMTSLRGGWSDSAGRCLVDAVPPLQVELMYLCSESSPQFCAFFSPSYKMPSFFFNTAMLFDLLVLVLTTIGLIISPGRSSLWHLLFQQGVVYFIVAFVANMLPTILVPLNLNRT